MWWSWRTFCVIYCDMSYFDSWFSLVTFNFTVRLTTVRKQYILRTDFPPLVSLFFQITPKTGGNLLSSMHTRKCELSASSLLSLRKTVTALSLLLSRILLVWCLLVMVPSGPLCYPDRHIICSMWFLPFPNTRLPVTYFLEDFQAIWYHRYK